LIRFGQAKEFCLDCRQPIGCRSRLSTALALSTRLVVDVACVTACDRSLTLCCSSLFNPRYGAFAARGTPKDIVGKLNTAAIEAPADPAVRSGVLVKSGAECCGRSSKSLHLVAARIERDRDPGLPIDAAMLPRVSLTLNPGYEAAALSGLIDGFGEERLPTVDFAHADLTGSEQSNIAAVSADGSTVCVWIASL
jgi:hypothetical protein